MEKIYNGKTKNLYRLEDGNILFEFKDDITGVDGKADTGGDEVVGQVQGLGNKNLKLSAYFFDLLASKGIDTHYVKSDIEKNTMVVKVAEFFGDGLEVITRYKAVGSFIRRYGLYAKEGQDLDEYVEITLKDDKRNDPLITKEGLEKLNILRKGQYEEIETLNRACVRIIKEEVEKSGLVLYDIKLEFGLIDGKIHLIDEISGGNMRVYYQGEHVDSEDVISYILA